MIPQIDVNPPDFTDLPALHRLLADSFAYMAARIDPPSSKTRLGLGDLRAKIAAEDLFLVRDAAGPVACLFGTPRDAVYYVGKLAVAAPQRGRGLARGLIGAAAARARAAGLAALELQSRVELVENHAAFARMGFAEVGRSAHPGYAQPTTITFRRSLRS